ncbi:hypothetical protein [Paraburkholderia caballeronis]|uniref:hypothetical protein n=1 Tax=Paraburkholderia caballeronis TaxID=416943 RepID=UPI0010668FF9|nr:hypothetical protein [Paraburkholderia caballeronis]
MLDELRRAGYTASDVAAFTGIPKSTLLGYKNLGTEPDHWGGDVVLGIWSDATGRARNDAPRRPIEFSAAAARR